MTCAEARAAITRLLVGREPAAFAALRAHVRACGSCRAAYDDLAAGEALLGGGADGDLGAAERELLAGVVLGAPAASRWRLRPLWVAAPLVAAAAVALVVVLPRPPAAPPPVVTPRVAAPPAAVAPPASELTPRGGAPDAAVAPRVGLRALCLEGAGESITVRSLGDPALPGERPRCRVRDRLGFAVSNATGAPVHLTVLVRGADGHVRPAYPVPGEAARPAPLPPDEEEDALDVGFRLDGLRPGPVTIFGVFSRGALALEPLARAAGDPRPAAALTAAGAETVITLRAEIGP